MHPPFVTRLNRRALLALGAAALWASGPALAAPPINTLSGGFFGSSTDTAIRGYDPVAYFTEGKPVQGHDEHVYQWQGAKWKFASADHLAKFRAAPDKYAPQYGGYCAYGVAQGNLVKIEPENFTVLDGKLYLNFDADIQATWLKDPAGYIKQADAMFPALLKK
jgi:YHS domain-containing protein